MNLSLKLSFTSTFSILVLALIFPVFAQDISDNEVQFSLAPYRTGERLTYNVSFSSFPSAAHIELQVMSRGIFYGRDAVELHAHVETTGVVNVALFALNNDYITYIDPDTGLPFRAQETVRDALKSIDASQDFNQPSGTVAIPARQRGFPGTYDFLSAVYRARALPLVEGATYTLSVKGSTDTYTADMRVVGRELVRTNLGSYNSLVTQVKFGNNARLKSLKVYFSDDERHVPVLVTARVTGGELRAELAGSEFITPAPAASPTPVPAPTVSGPPLTSPPSTRGPAATTTNEDWPFKVGEQLNYQVFLGTSAIPVGVADFQVRSRSRYFNRDGLLVAVKAQTTGAAARLFVANDQINSYLDSKALLPFRTEMSLSEGHRRLSQVLTFDQDYGTATTNMGTKIEIPIGTYDYASLFYAIRTFNLNPPKRNAVSILVENKPKTLFISSVKREAIRLGEQSVPTIALALTTDDPQSDKYQFRIWVSDDKRRLPLRITCATELGALRADLVIVPAVSQ